MTDHKHDKAPSKLRLFFLSRWFRIVFVTILVILIMFVLLPGYIIALAQLVFNYNMVYLRALLLSTVAEFAVAISWLLADDNIRKLK